MSDEIREQLSALLDDELSELERPLLLGRLQRDTELRECIGRYQLIGEVMRGGEKAATSSVADRVQAALAQDVPIPRSGGRMAARMMNWWKPVAGIAVAASVALVALLAVTEVRDTTTAEVPAVAAVEPEPAPVVAVEDEQWDRIEPQLDKRLSGYLVNHNEFAASRGVQGVMPYVRIVGFENGQQ